MNPRPTERPPIEPLDTFYRDAGRPLPSVRVVSESELPEPQRRLLAHHADMTRTLEAFHGDSIHLEVKSCEIRGDELWREVVLTLDASGRPVEFGAIRIWVDRFPATSRDEIRACRRPLGAILNASGMAYTSRPTAFLALEPDAFISKALALATTTTLYGRRNALRDGQGAVLAEIVEILPPC
jgi:chorismate-pyruvate lyase